MTTIYEICQFGDVNELNIAIKNGTNPNVPDDKGMYPIHYASLFGNEAIIRVLLKEGCNINVQTKAGSTPLHFAVKSGRLALTRILILHSADPSITDFDGNNSLILACKRGFLPIAEYILLHSYGLASKAIGWCCEEGYTNLIRMFIDYLTPKELMEGLCKMDLSNWIETPKPIMSQTGSFEYKVEYNPFDIQYCDYLVDSTPPLKTPLKLHFSIISSEIPYFTLIPSGNSIPMSPEGLVVMANYCYTHSIDPLLLTKNPISTSLEILRLSHPNRIGSIVTLLAKTIEQIIQSDLTEIDVLVDFFKTQDHRYFYETLFQGLIYILLKNITDSIVTEIVGTIPRGFLDDMINLLPSQHPEITLPNYKALLGFK